MPYVKRGSRRVVKRGSKRNSVVRTIARQETRKALKKTIELKNYYSRQPFGTGLTYNGSVYPILLDPNSATWFSQGTARNQFIGDTVKPMLVSVHYSITMNAGAAANSYNYVRLVLLQVKGGGTPSAANVLQSVGNISTPSAFIDPTYTDTFTVLSQKMIQMNQQNGIQRSGIISAPARKLRKINFVGTTASSTSANGIFLIAYGNSSSVSDVFITYQGRLAFQDA